MQPGKTQSLVLLASHCSCFLQRDRRRKRRLSVRCTELLPSLSPLDPAGSSLIAPARPGPDLANIAHRIQDEESLPLGSLNPDLGKDNRVLTVMGLFVCLKDPNSALFLLLLAETACAEER